MAKWISNLDRSQAALKIAKQLPSSVSAIAGVSRGGISIAVQIAELLHVHCYSISKEGQIIDLAHGFRLRNQIEGKGELLIVDDTVANGTTFKKLKSNLKVDKTIITAAGFVPSYSLHHVDIIAEIVDLPHYLEWNFFNSVYVQHTAFDFDGVFCENCPRESDDDGEKYVRFLKNARPLYLVRKRTIPLIVTGRLEKYRAQTLQWLNKWGMNVERLVMAPWKDKQERSANWKTKEFKGKIFAESDCKIFVESSARQAKEIYEASRKTVICTDTGEIFDDCSALQGNSDCDTTSHRKQNVA